MGSSADRATLPTIYPDELAQFWQTPLSFTPPQAESLLAFKSRVLESVETLTQQMHKQGWTTGIDYFPWWSD